VLIRQVEAYLDHLTVERGAAANTLSSYRRDLNRYVEYLTDHEIGDLTEVRETHVEDFVSALRRGDATVTGPRWRPARSPAR
jgi:integrase/recombinase XerD